MTKLELTTKYGKVTIEANMDDLSLPDLRDYLIVPVLLAVGFARETIKECIETDAL